MLKFYDEANKDKAQSKQEKEFASRIELMLNPDKAVVRDSIKVIAYIDPASSQSNLIKFRTDNIGMYVKANLEGQIMYQRQQ